MAAHAQGRDRQGRGERACRGRQGSGHCRAQCRNRASCTPGLRNQPAASRRHSRCRCPYGAARRQGRRRRSSARRSAVRSSIPRCRRCRRRNRRIRHGVAGSLAPAAAGAANDVPVPRHRTRSAPRGRATCWNATFADGPGRRGPCPAGRACAFFAAVTIAERSRCRCCAAGRRAVRPCRQSGAAGVAGSRVEIQVVRAAKGATQVVDTRGPFELRC